MTSLQITTGPEFIKPKHIFTSTIFKEEYDPNIARIITTFTRTMYSEDYEEYLTTYFSNTIANMMGNIDEILAQIQKFRDAAIFTPILADKLLADPIYSTVHKQLCPFASDKGKYAALNHSLDEQVRRNIIATRLEKELGTKRDIKKTIAKRITDQNILALNKPLMNLAKHALNRTLPLFQQDEYAPQEMLHTLAYYSVRGLCDSFYNILEDIEHSTTHSKRKLIIKGVQEFVNYDEEGLRALHYYWNKYPEWHESFKRAFELFPLRKYEVNKIINPDWFEKRMYWLEKEHIFEKTNGIYHTTKEIARNSQEYWSLNVLLFYIREEIPQVDMIMPIPAGLDELNQLLKYPLNHSLEHPPQYAFKKACELLKTININEIYDLKEHTVDLNVTIAKREIGNN